MAAEPITARWLNVAQAATYAGVGRRTIYTAIKRGRLKAAVVNDRRDYRLLAAWVDQWLIESSEPREIRRVS